MKDCILCTMPFMRDINIPLLAPYLLKGILEKNNFSSKVLDLNEELCSFLGYDDFISSFFAKYSINSKEDPIYEKTKSFVERYANEVASYSPKVVGLSLMSFQSCHITEQLAKQIKEIDSNIVVAIGGPGAEMCGKSLKENGTIDHYVLGDGETPLLEIMNGKYTSSGIRNEEELDSLPFADYSEATNKNVLWIHSSRGCRRNCTFCNVNHLFGKYRNRSGESLADEMIYNSDLYETKIFILADNAINTSQKFIDKFCNRLLDHYNGQVPFRWSSNAIIKPDFDFTLFRKTNCYSLMVGVETGSQKIINDMKKGFTLDQVREFIKGGIESEIHLKLYMTTGYITETEDDFQETLELIKHYRKLYGNSINFRAVSPIVIWRDSILHKKRIDLDITLGEEKWNAFSNWSYKDNNIETRLDRYKRLRSCCEDDIVF